MKKLIAIALLFAIAALSGCDSNKGRAGKSPADASKAVEGAAAPEFSVRDLAGTEVKLSALKGYVVLVNFWATWCPPCREEIPSMMKLNQAMTGKPFRMLAISIDEGGKAAVEEFFRRSGLALPACLDGDGSVSRLYGTTGVPETFIVDKSGVIQKKIVGGLDWSAPEVVAYLNELAKR